MEKTRKKKLEVGKTDHLQTIISKGTLISKPRAILWFLERFPFENFIVLHVSLTYKGQDISLYSQVQSSLNAIE